MWVFGYEYSQIIKGNLGTNEVGKLSRKMKYEKSFWLWVFSDNYGWSTRKRRIYIMQKNFVKAVCIFTLVFFVISMTAAACPYKTPIKTAAKEKTLTAKSCKTGYTCNSPICKSCATCKKSCKSCKSCKKVMKNGKAISKCNKGCACKR